MTLTLSQQYYPLQLKDCQLVQISSPEKIQTALLQKNCLGFYGCENGAIVGFALVREYEPRQFFLWNFVIDCRFQGMGKGKVMLSQLINCLEQEYLAQVITTTYRYGNHAAKKLYEQFGFVESSTICQDNIHEINMIRRLF